MLARENNVPANIKEVYQKTQFSKMRLAIVGTRVYTSCSCFCCTLGPESQDRRGCLKTTLDRPYLLEAICLRGFGKDRLCHGKTQQLLITLSWERQTCAKPETIRNVSVSGSMPAPLPLHGHELPEISCVGKTNFLVMNNKKGIIELRQRYYKKKR